MYDILEKTKLLEWLQGVGGKGRMNRHMKLKKVVMDQIVKEGPCRVVLV